ncbi:MAG: ankyrin repeat domain-containing protein [Acidimicrobiales bacterium]
MDKSFGPATLAIYAGDMDSLGTLLFDDPGLATRTSSVSHPTLLQLVACEAAQLPQPVDAALVLVEAGSAMTGPLVSAAGCGSTSIVELLLDLGADIDGDESWTPLDEALYWANSEIARRLLDRGATVRALSTAAGIGSIDGVEAFFEAGGLGSDAGPIGSPFPDTTPAELGNDPQSIIDHAFVMAVNCGSRDAAKLLFDRGAEINAAPPGYHWRGTALHAACWRGDANLVEWLLFIGADPTIRDRLANSDAAGWATHHGHAELLELLQ